MRQAKIHNFLKEQSNENFYLYFFHYSNLPGPPTNGLKKFWILVKILRSYSNLRFKNLTTRGMIYQGEIDLPGYDTPRSHVLVEFLIDSSGYDTPGRLTRRGIIP